MIGTLIGVGVGPGDPELITVKAFRRLKESPVIAYPKKAKGSKSYAHKIIDLYVNPNEKEMLGLVFPMTKDAEILDREWNIAVDKVWESLNAGKDVAFVTEGDPLLYSTFIHMMKLMQERYPNVPIEIIPGISSINGAAARLGLPLADGDEHVAIIPATNDYDEMKQAIIDHDCIVFLKVAKAIPTILPILRELKLVDRAAVVTKVTSTEEIIWNLDELEDADVGYLTLMVVRK